MGNYSCENKQGKASGTAALQPASSFNAATTGFERELTEEAKSEGSVFTDFKVRSAVAW